MLTPRKQQAGRCKMKPTGSAGNGAEREEVKRRENGRFLGSGHTSSNRRASRVFRWSETQQEGNRSRDEQFV